MIDYWKPPKNFERTWCDHCCDSDFGVCPICGGNL